LRTGFPCEGFSPSSSLVLARLFLKAAFGKTKLHS